VIEGALSRKSEMPKLCGLISGLVCPDVRPPLDFFIQLG